MLLARRAALLGLLALLGAARAQVEREIRFESDPTDARVYLLSGDRRELLGRTPLLHRAEFHSEQSVLRVEFRHAGRITTQLEMAASNPSVVARMERRPLSVQLDPMDDAARRSLERSLPALNGWLVQTLALLNDSDADFDGVPARLGQTPSGLQLEVTLTANAVPRQQATAEHWWHKLAQPMIDGIAPLAREVPGLVWVSLNVRTPATVGTFSVEASVVDDQESVCVSGIRRVFDPCATQDTRTGSYGRCQPGYRSVVDPCLTRTVVTRRRATLSPQSGSRGAREEFAYRVSLKDLPRGSAPAYENVSVRHVDGAGKLVFERAAAAP